jgi:hypothetical protein
MKLVKQLACVQTTPDYGNCAPASWHLSVPKRFQLQVVIASLHTDADTHGSRSQHQTEARTLLAKQLWSQLGVITALD